MTEDKIVFKSADTGTAIGLMIELWHRGDSPEKAINRVKSASEIGMGDRPKPFILADFSMCEKAFLRYCEDPRNMVDVPEESLEKEVKLELKDLRGKPIYFEGHLDQARLDRFDTWVIWDVKFSSIFTPAELMAEKVLQLCFYTLGLLDQGINASIGGIIAPRQYITKIGAKKRPEDIKGVFTESSWTITDARKAAKLVVTEISRIRYGKEPVVRIGKHCDFCPIGDFAKCSNVFGIKPVPH